MRLHDLSTDPQEHVNLLKGEELPDETAEARRVLEGVVQQSLNRAAVMASRAAEDAPADTDETADDESQQGDDR